MCKKSFSLKALCRVKKQIILKEMNHSIEYVILTTKNQMSARKGTRYPSTCGYYNFTL